MLSGLTIRDFVLIERLELAFHPGLCVLTGETGAGKSILLDALGLALGMRAESGMVRPGAAQAAVAAEFALPADHPSRALLAEHGLAADDGEEGRLVLRRVLSADGRSRAFINDAPASVGLLRELGDSLVEIQGQFEQRGLADPATQRALLDAYGGYEPAIAAQTTAWRVWREAASRHGEASAALDRARAEEDALRHAAAELDAVEPRPGEEALLAERRQVLVHREKLMGAVNAALAELSGERGAERALGAAARLVERAREKAGGRLDAAAAALERATVEAGEARAQLEAVLRDDEPAGGLEAIEERLFTLRALARKHGVAVDELAALRSEIAARLATIEDGGAEAKRLLRAAEEARADYAAAAQRVSKLRRNAARALDRAIAAELAPLRLDKARFRTIVEALPEEEWGEHGQDRVRFEVATNPGAPMGPLARIASGGELSRLMLALKVVLARGSPATTLVFDEVDSGIGGAVAAAVGERLQRLGENLQVLVVTHSPQVAAKGTHHWRVAKEHGNGRALTRVEELSTVERREEIARMLSGAAVTAEARAAAESLILGTGAPR
ncbi:MAG TPA: DNA repair protein RecN [Stellaceae bacterium]|nr:DNA repair protein RecN [Stellaceae bacterium]